MTAMTATTANTAHGWVLEAVDRYEGPLLRYARRLLDDVDLAADAVQHAFLKLCEEPSSRLDGRVAPWLFRVCRNRAVDHLRHAGRERHLLDAESADAEAASREADPALVAERADLASLVSALLDCLPAPQRETLGLWSEGLSHKQIAEVTGRTEGHVRVITHRGLAALRAHPQVQALLADHHGGSAAANPSTPAPRDTP